jgi:hypothetical protein
MEGINMTEKEKKLIRILESYLRMIKRNKNYPTVLIDDLEKSIEYVLKNNK